jgi:hypothetical protein
MNYLSKFTPAETWILLRGNTSLLRDLLKFTLMDILLKQVLWMEDVEGQPGDRDPFSGYKYVRPGKNSKAIARRSRTGLLGNV